MTQHHDIKKLTENFNSYLSELQSLIKENKTPGNCVEFKDTHGILDEILFESKNVSMAIYEHEWLVEQQSIIMSQPNGVINEGVISNIATAVTSAFFNVVSKILNFFIKIQNIFQDISNLSLSVSLFVLSGIHSFIAWIKKFHKNNPKLFWAIVAIIVVIVLLITVALFFICAAPAGVVSESGDTICPPELKGKCITRGGEILKEVMADPNTTPEMKTTIRESYDLLNKIQSNEMLSSRRSDLTNLDVNYTAKVFDYSEPATKLLTKVLNIASQQVKGVMPEGISDTIVSKITEFLPSFLSVLSTASIKAISKVKSIKSKK